jgi:hypothetical protein
VSSIGGQYPSDKEALAIYQAWDKWKYLAYWFDIYTEYSLKTENNS